MLEADPEREHFHFFNWHLSGYDRKQCDAGRQNYIPCNLGEIPDYYRRFIDPPEIMVVKTCPADENGFFNFGPPNLWHGASSTRQDRDRRDRPGRSASCTASSNGLHESQVDYVVEGGGEPAPRAPERAADRCRPRGRAADRGRDRRRRCLQIGIGAMPNAVCSLLLDSGVRNLGIHTEMLTDGIIDLYRAGRGQRVGEERAAGQGRVQLRARLPARSTTRSTATPISSASRRDDQPAALLIMQNDRLVAINNTTQMDLQGQASSESSGHRHISGTGGQLQFVRGAYASSGGKSFICMSSTYERNGMRRSRIVLNLTPGNVVTAPRSDMMYVVTEYGIVNLKGKSVPERAKAMISIAHPDFREDLEREARDQRPDPQRLRLRVARGVAGL